MMRRSWAHWRKSWNLKKFWIFDKSQKAMECGTGVDYTKSWTPTICWWIRGGVTKRISAYCVFTLKSCLLWGKSRNYGILREGSHRLLKEKKNSFLSSCLSNLLTSRFQKPYFCSRKILFKKFGTVVKNISESIVDQSGRSENNYKHWETRTICATITVTCSVQAETVDCPKMFKWLQNFWSNMKPAIM